MRMLPPVESTPNAIDSAASFSRAKRVRYNGTMALAAAVDRATAALSISPAAATENHLQSTFERAAAKLSSMEQAHEISADDVMRISQYLVENQGMTDFFCGYSKSLSLIWVKRKLQELGN